MCLIGVATKDTQIQESHIIAEREREREREREIIMGISESSSQTFI